MSSFQKNTVAVVFGLLLLISCSGNEGLKSDEKTEQSESLAVSGETVHENSTDLSKLSPLSTEQFKAFFPATLIGLPQTSFVESFMPGLGTGSATYRTGNRSIRVMIIDGAGEKGSGAVSSYQFSHTKDYDEKGSWGYTKTIYHEGIKMKESGLSEDEFVWALFYKDRFAVDIEAKEVTKEELGAIMKELNLENLPTN
ncbi:hypothetical protein [Algoriphagus sp.]|uniref:hypothetical protein n=1 Tax=Algoriphagus sp. TaxID=1872435 RepID=UPI0025E968F0|nr:hypothetical protein [Algoriphagus sp.]